MEEQVPLANLFGKVPIYDDNHLELILNTMTKETAMIFLINAVEYSFKKGVYSFAETELISKALRTLDKQN